ncbi:MAG: glycosyltransferase family 4 protein [Gammaproteobacteria bacterium]|nr:glycosyltransferase family 4 protein [Gammaproteobacteria bacterium]
MKDWVSRRGFPFIETLGFSRFDNSRHGCYRGLRWIILLRELLLIPSTLLSIIKARRLWGDRIDLIHANDFSLLFAAIFAKFIFKKPAIIHIRDLFAGYDSLRARLLRFLAAKYLDKVVAIDNAVANSLGCGSLVSVIHNGEEISDRRLDESQPEHRDLKVGIVANFAKNKGILDFIEAARICVHERGIVDVKFLVFGDSQVNTKSAFSRLLRIFGFLHDVKNEAMELVSQSNLLEYVLFRGFVLDTQEIYRDIDVLCFPSHLDAVGRPVFEAAAYAKPSIVALRTRDNDDAIVHNITGLIVPERNPGAIADSVALFAANRSEVRRMGLAALELGSRDFDLRKNAKRLADLYLHVCRSSC